MSKKEKKVKARIERKERIPVRVLGVMTGTSCDGLDAACVEITPKGWNLLWSTSVKYPQALRERVLEFRATESTHTIKKILKINQDVGEWYRAAIKKILSRHKPTPDIIANHGQTIAHFPGIEGGGTTLQLGDPTRITAATGITVVSHFREGDLAAGGQGAPLVPLFHKLLSKKLGFKNGGISIHNIGGISNLTYIHPNGKLLAFDTGPGNIWIDAAVEKVTDQELNMDRGGKMAAQGEVDKRAVQEALTHSYFSQAIPKSTGRDDFPFELLLSKTQAQGNSLVATATEISVESIAQAYEKWILKKKFPLKAIFFCGGGAKNKTLINGIQQRLPQVKIADLDELGIDPQLIEAKAFALFGYLSLLGHPLGGSWTGAKAFGSPGQLTPGKNWPDVLKKANTLLKKGPRI